MVKIQNSKISLALLDRKNKKITIKKWKDGKKKLIPKKDGYKKTVPDEYFSEFKETWKRGRDFSKVSKVERIDAEGLERMGFAVICQYVEGQKLLTIEEQRNTYGEGRFEVGSDGMRGHRILYNKYEKIVKLMGKNAYYINSNGYIHTGNTKWIPLEEDYEKEFETDKFGRVQLNSAEEDRYLGISKMRYGEPEREDEERFEIKKKDIPVMITDENKLLCIPKSQEVQKIGLTGVTGTGKSYCMNAIMNRVYWKWGDRIIFLNDALNQFHSLHQPGNKQTEILDLFGVKPRPLPTLNLYLSCPNIKMRYKEIDQKYVVSFKEFLKDLQYYTDKIKDWDFKGTASYIPPLIPSLSKCNSLNEIKDVLKNELPKKENGNLESGMNQMMAKWIARFSSMFEEKFLETNNEVNAKWMVKGEWKDPIFACIECGIVPVVNTYKAKRKKQFRNVMAKKMEKIVEYQMDFPENDQPRIWVIIDEIKEIYSNQKDNCSKALEEIFRQGRFNNIGFMLNIQSYPQLHEDIRANMTHLISGRVRQNKELNRMKKDFGLTKDQKSQIQKLKGHKLMAMSKKKWVTYDPKGNREESLGGVFIGKSLPPLALHLDSDEKIHIPKRLMHTNRTKIGG